MTVSFSPPLWELKLFPQPYEDLLSNVFTVEVSLSLKAWPWPALASTHRHSVSSRAWEVSPPELGKCTLPVLLASSTDGWNPAALPAVPLNPSRLTCRLCHSLSLSAHFLSLLCPGLFHNCFLSSFSFFHALDCTFHRQGRLPVTAGLALQSFCCSWL